MYKKLVDLIKSIYPDRENIVLHEPCMGSLEEEHVKRCLSSTFVSSVGEYVSLVEKKIAKITGAKFAVAVSSGTAALHTALIASGVKEGDLVLTQSLTFVATANAIKYCNAEPLFIDVDKKSLSISAEKLSSFLEKEVLKTESSAIHIKTGRRISACVPMHTFGHVADIDKIVGICQEYNITVIEDAAEAFGSRYKSTSAGRFGKAGIISFNGNKIVTSGGGGAIITDDEYIHRIAKHISTTAKTDNPYHHEHDMVGYNYRMPNLNAAFLFAQLEQLDYFIEKKRGLAAIYSDFFKNTDIKFFMEPENCESNYWLNTIFLNTEEDSLSFLDEMNKNRIYPRRVWKNLHLLPMYKNCLKTDLSLTEEVSGKIINLPSSVPSS